MTARTSAADVSVAVHATEGVAASPSEAPPHLATLAIVPSVALAGHAGDTKKAPEEAAGDNAVPVAAPAPGSVEAIEPTQTRTCAFADALLLLGLVAMVAGFVFVSVRGLDGLGLGLPLPVSELVFIQWMRSRVAIPEWLWLERRSELVHHGLVMTAIAFALSLAVSLLITSAPRAVMKGAAYTCIVASLGGTVFLFIVSTWYYGVAALVAFLFCCRFTMRMTPLVEFIAINLHVALAAVLRHQALYAVCLLVLALQLAWVWCSITAFLRVADFLVAQKGLALHAGGGLAGGAACRYSSSCASTECVRVVARTASETANTLIGVCTTPTLPATTITDGAILAAVVLACLWGLLVLRNVCHATVARVVGGFWRGAGRDVSVTLVATSLGRSLGRSLGTISLISLCVVVCQAIAFALDQLINRPYSASKEKCGSCLERITSLFNRWTLVYVGIYGHSTRQASNAVRELFVQRGFTAIIEADLVNQMMVFAASAVAAASVALSVTILSIGFDDSYASNAISLIVGFGIGITPLTIIDSACAAVFVCFAEDPSALHEHHPELYESLAAAWRNVYPEPLRVNGYY